MSRKRSDKFKVESLESRCLLSGHDLIPTDGLIAYYPFNGNADDQSGNGNNGIIHGAELITDRFGNRNGAFSFYSIDDYISVRDSPSLDLTEKLTISAWIEAEDLLENGFIAVKGDPEVFENYSIALINSANPVFRIHSSDGRYISVQTDVSNINSTWTNVVGIYNGNELAIYINGVKKNWGSPSAGNLIDNSSELYIGRNFHTQSEFQAKIDDIAIYNRALSDDEIQKLYTHKPESNGSQSPIPIIIVPGLLGSLDERFSTLPVHFRKFIKNVSFNNEIKINPFHPSELIGEKVNNTYQKIIETFKQSGYTFCDLDNPKIENDVVNCDNDANLFFAAYDWRQPVLVNPNNRKELLWDNNTETFQSGVEYLDWWIKLAKEKWLSKGGIKENFSVNIIAHSLGGLVARAYIEEANDALQETEKVNKLIMLGTPNHGSVSAYQFWNPFLFLDVSDFNLENYFLKRYLKNAIIKLEETYELPRGGIQAKDLVPSLRDLMPTFPFLKSDTNSNFIIPVKNYLLNRLNRDIEDLTNATDVLLIGTNNLSTPIRARLNENILNFKRELVGDGTVIYDKTLDNYDAGLILQDLKSIAFSDINHNELPRNQDILCKVVDELLINPPENCNFINI